MTSALELDEAVLAKVKSHCARGDELANVRAYSDALKQYWMAWDLLPEPKTEWEAATWVLAAIGDANFLSGDFEAGRDNLGTAMHCPGALGNPFIHLRLGQCQFELGALDRAADELIRAYMGAGPEIFENDERKYIEFLATRADDIELRRRQKRASW